jgi:hypothetical protein
MQIHKATVKETKGERGADRWTVTPPRLINACIPAFQNVLILFQSSDELTESSTLNTTTSIVYTQHLMPMALYKFIMKS